MRREVKIDFLPSSASLYSNGYAVVAIDVIRATTVVVTGVSMGRRCFVADSLDSAWRIASALPDPLLAGELGGRLLEGFEMNNSPSELARRNDIHRPLVLLSSAGTKLMHEAGKCEAAYVACFRNYSATACQLIAHHERVAVIGAGTNEEFREEDQMCCAHIASELLKTGYEADPQTRQIVQRWEGAPAEACSVSKSVAFLRRTAQTNDLDFILSHIDDLDSPVMVCGNEVVSGSIPKRATPDVSPAPQAGDAVASSESI